MDARKRILSRLQTTAPSATPGDYSVIEQKQWSLQERVERLKTLMESVHTEVHLCTHLDWPVKLVEVIREKNIRTLLATSRNESGKLVHERIRDIELREYENPVEEWKSEMLHDIDAAFTGTWGGIAETGSLILSPDEHEPRLMSLVPPIHIALLDSSHIYNTFLAALREGDWVKNGLPTNLLLISGPSKTSDIEQTLAYGVHGPKELVVLLRQQG